MPKQILSKKPIYNLSLVLQETGIKADTLRAWERRYNLPQPRRSQSGHRLFSEFDVETIKWLIARQNEGMRISRAVRLWREIESDGQDPLLTLSGQIAPPLSTTEQAGISLASERNRWIQACLSFDEPAAEQVLNQSFAQFSMETACIQILQSGLAAIGSLWYQGSVTVQQEHFAAELAVRRLYALLLAAPQPLRSATILAACPPGENHTFSTLLITLLLRYRGWNMIYLGANVPGKRIKETVEKTNPDLVIMSAMRLVTAAALFDTAILLYELDVPVAFGGRIFNTSPSIIQRIPGYYLGESISEAIPIIETLLTGSLPKIEFVSETGRFSETISHLMEKKLQIEVQAINNIREKPGTDILMENIQSANDYLMQDLIAALSLGDLSLLQPNLEWVEGLIANRDIAGELLIEYLQAHHDALQTHLDERGLPIIDWLASHIKKE